MTGVQAEVAAEQERALDVFYNTVRADKEQALYHIQELRDYVNKLGYELAHRDNYDMTPIEAAKRALKAQEYDSVAQELDDLADILNGVSLEWEYTAGDQFADEHERVEVYVGDYKLP